MSKHSLLALGFVTLMIAASPAARAGALLDTGLGNSTTSRTADSGPGQGVTVGTTTALTQFGFYLDTPNGADVKFMIWSGDNSTLLYSQTESFAANSTMSLALTNPFSFTLNAGSTYYFGVIADNNMDVSFFYPIISSTQNDLTLKTDGNSNYSTFASPSFDGLAGATIALQLVGNGGTAAPEPGTVGMLSLGVLGLVAFARKRKSAGVPAK